jgi:hypothetical protein
VGHTMDFLATTILTALGMGILPVMMTVMMILTKLSQLVPWPKNNAWRTWKLMISIRRRMRMIRTHCWEHGFLNTIHMKVW